MKELLRMRKEMLLYILIAAVVLLAVLYICGELGCFGCNVFGDSCGFWSCFESCTDCMSCMMGCK